MNKKLVFRAALLLSMCLSVFISCSEDDEKDPPKPVIVIEELGSGHDSPNDKKAVAGSDLHLQAQIMAEGLIARIDVEIHQESGGNFEIEKSYTTGSYVNVKNTTLHEHIDIPEDTPVGKYHLHLTVTDKLGQTATAESELTISKAPVNIEINGLTFGAGHDFPDNKIGYIGTAPVIEAASIKAEEGIDKVYLMMHGEGTNTFVIDTTFTCNGETELENFHKHVMIPEVAPAGEYHMHFKVYDKSGKTSEATMNIEIKETGISVSNLEIGSENSSKASNIHTEFLVKTTDPITSIRARIYKANAPTTYFFNETYSEPFSAGDVKEYTFHKHLKAEGAEAGDYIIEFRVSDNKGAYTVIKDRLTIITE
jgi:hypothetical protein